LRSAFLADLLTGINILLVSILKMNGQIVSYSSSSGYQCKPVDFICPNF
jgi:hypothetical protein